MEKIKPIGTQRIPEGDLDTEITLERDMGERRDKCAKELLGKKR